MHWVTPEPPRGDARHTRSRGSLFAIVGAALCTVPGLAVRLSGAGLPNVVAPMVFGLAMQTFGTKLTDEQEVLMHLADITMDLFSAESAVLRAQAATGSRAPLHVDAARVFVSDAAMRIDASARQALAEHQLFQGREALQLLHSLHGRAGVPRAERLQVGQLAHRRHSLVAERQRATNRPTR
jgi:HPt (histidine-containing phosphotransfer) domain-containing protein